jgi:hypothetical protein
MDLYPSYVSDSVLVTVVSYLSVLLARMQTWLCYACVEMSYAGRMSSSGMLRRVAHVRTDVSEELSASIRVTRIGELGTLAVARNPTHAAKKYRSSQRASGC